MRAASLAPVLLAACTFSAPGESSPTDNGGDGGDGGDGGGSQVCPDDDRDMICNDLDDWPCGVKPDDPGDAGGGDIQSGRAWGARNIAIGTDRRVIANRNQDFAAELDWSLTLYCNGLSTCKGQIEFGYGGAPRAGCLFDGDVVNLQTKTGQAMTMFRAPPTPGVYELRVNGARRPVCGTDSWYIGDPGERSTIAILCVPP